ncbi:hypothetical protein [Amycolatopsis nigrescens]|uniref:hypothetical protein n=1 Tax=Amycolatopsis nigrescens TaxID=381445 RepID=UPI000378AFBA|nr:hypothetical protein [Amycolatopsis nigrescens]
MLKKAGFVTATVAGLMMIGGTAFASPMDSPSSSHGDDKGYVTFSEAYHQFIEGGGALGYGAASLVAGAYVGIIQTPQNILDNASHTGG